MLVAPYKKMLSRKELLTIQTQITFYKHIVTNIHLIELWVMEACFHLWKNINLELNYVFMP